MRILIATRHRNMVGGTEKYLQALLPGFVRREHEVALAYETAFDPKRESIDSAAPPLDAWCLADLGPEVWLNSIASWKPDVVYSQGLDSAGLQRVLLDKYPTVLYAHNYYGTCATGQKCHAFPQAQPCTRQFGPMCLALHYPRRCGGLHPGTMWRMYNECAEVNAQLPDYYAILIASRHMQAEYQRHGIDPARLHLVPLPAPDSIPLLAGPEQKVPQGRILFVSRLTRLKGGDYLIRAIAQASTKLGQPLHLTVAGDGPERSNLEALAHKLGIAAKFVGWIDAARKMELMRQADLVAMPSVWPEPFGLVGIEAGSLGIPSVAYAVGGISDWLSAGQSGELAPGDPPTAGGLADAIVRSLANRSHYFDLCRGAWEMANRFTLSAHMSGLMPILKEAAARRPSENQIPEELRIHA